MVTIFTRQSESDPYEEVGPDNPLSVAMASDPTATTATRTSVASSASSVTLLPANATRVRGGVKLTNESSAVLYLAYGAVASATSYTYALAAGALWEMPPFERYTGRIDGIWASANGFARITELTP